MSDFTRLEGHPKRDPMRLGTQHLRRLTDARGLIHRAVADVPDRSAGYDMIEQADALRLCALASDTADAEGVRGLAQTYFQALDRARRPDGAFSHTCDAAGRYAANGDDTLVQSRVARASAAVIVSELPIGQRLAAAQWWSELLPAADDARAPTAAAHWLLALAQLRAADPGRDLQRAQRLADFLVQCYDRHRARNWEWFEPAWTPGAACIPAGLWAARQLLGDDRYAIVAERCVEFLVCQLYKDGMIVPPGTHSQWRPDTGKPAYDQLPSEVCSVIELLIASAQAGGSAAYSDLAEQAGSWFTGANLVGRTLIDAETGGCFDALHPGGPNPDQGAAATLACLISQAALADRTPAPEDTFNFAPAFCG